ncbi:hypothetical protein C5E45_17260 [Nocardia nova]|uniref:Uncharacterized protein n=1 Tax=Nocardia nova TaxID=37330 RepID=A0A2S6AP10_9NOCA|nr:hypothetical protein C5E41_12705 [Nocardia nova]PPJ36975.1 hypothetical protein C5E45_17260 [Nocardia nova]
MTVAEVGDTPDNGQHGIASGYHHLFRYLASVGTEKCLEFPTGGGSGRHHHRAVVRAHRYARESA